MSSAKAAKGTLFQRGDGGSPEVFTTVSEVKTIGGPSVERDLIDVTNHDSASSYREFVASLRDGGEVTLECNHLPGTAAQDALKTDFESDTARNYRVMWPQFSNKKATFAAFVMNAQPSDDVGEASTITYTLKITGPVTWA